MLKAIFTLDFEIHGNGDGCSHALMVEPTDRMLREFDVYGAKLTIMADIGEILKFKQYAEEYGRDDYHYDEIVAQLRDAIRRGHDVQLHIHSSYFNAYYEQGRWVQDWSEYDFAKLGWERMNEMVRSGKDFLESLLRPVDPNYRCHVFRAANWSVYPSRTVTRTLINNGIQIDTSVFKYGRRDGRVNFDYAAALSSVVPWRVDENDICARSDTGKLWEFPIYSERRGIGAFITPQRIYRALLERRHKLLDGSGGNPRGFPTVQTQRSSYDSWNWLTRQHAWKADFNQCSGRQLIRSLERAETKYARNETELPFVLIGHSKLFSRLNELSLRPFLEYVAKHPNRFGFGRFAEFQLDRVGALWDKMHLR